MIDIDTALSNPATVFDHPKDVLASKQLTREQKIQALHAWELDARQLEVAADENMSATADDLLADVHAALEQLGIDLKDLPQAPTLTGARVG